MICMFSAFHSFATGLVASGGCGELEMGTNVVLRRPRIGPG